MEESKRKVAGTHVYGMIDEMTINRFPVILGNGTPYGK
jgi:hypothetical protein